MTHGKAVMSPVSVGWHRWDGNLATADLIDQWAAPENRTDTDVWFSAITRVKGAYIYGNAEFTAEVYDFLHSRWIPLRTWDYVMKGIRGECYPCEDSVFNETYSITEIQR